MKKRETEAENSGARERILKASQTLIASNGFKGTTTKMIAKEAGVNEVTLFRHFTSKENILISLLRATPPIDTGERLRKCLEEPNLEMMLIKFGLHFYQGLLSRKELFLINLAEAEKRPEFSELMSINVSEVAKMLAEKLQSLADEGRLKQADFVVASLIYIQSLIGAFVIKNRMAKEFYPVEIERLCQSTAFIMLQGLLND